MFWNTLISQFLTRKVGIFCHYFLNHFSQRCSQCYTYSG